MRSILNKDSRGGQAQIIVTVLLILIVIAAVALVGNFVFKLIKENLQGTDCIKTTGQVLINNDFTDFSEGILNLSITRGSEEFNLTGISVTIGSGATSTPYTITPGVAIADEIAMYGDDLSSPGEAITLPKAQETLTYQIKIAGITEVKTLDIVPILVNDKKCGVSDSISL